MFTRQSNRSSATPGAWLRIAIALATAAVVLLVPRTANAEAERMFLDCGDPVGMIERTNGSSWWSLDEDGVRYSTRHITVSFDDEVVFEKTYGAKTGLGPSLFCTANHFEFVWEVELARIG